MTLREFLNAILNVIGASSLTDDEYETVDLDGNNFDLDTYEALLSVLNSRELVSNTVDRLRYYFLARGVEISEVDSQDESNILIGGSLCS